MNHGKRTCLSIIAVTLAAGRAGAQSLPAGRISDPTADFVGKSAVAGFTQATTSTAWCGSAVVVAFGDSGSAFESAAAGGAATNSISNIGYSVSTDAGKTFHDRGYLPAVSPGQDTPLAGDPVAACSDETTFYVAGLSIDGGATSVVLSRSSDGGSTFGPPAIVVPADGTHSVVADWLAVDPASPQDLYMAYVLQDVSGANCSSGTTPLPYFTLKMATSTDGGGTWKLLPGAGDKQCPIFDPSSRLDAPRVVPDGHGNAWVSWLETTGNPPTRNVAVALFEHGGFDRISIVATADPLAEGRSLQGYFYSLGAPSLAVDRTGRPGYDGTTYVAWAAPGSRVYDPVEQSMYGYGDVFMARSTDGGQTWTRPPVRVNGTLEPVTRLGTDQFDPVLAVDKTGALGMCWYDRRNDPANFLVDRYCGRSVNGGTTWTNVRKTSKPFAVVGGADFLGSIYALGDYDDLSADFLGRSPGFRGAYADYTLGNADVKLNSF